MPTLSINQMMEFTGQEYRTIKAALDGIPYEQVGPAYLYDSKVALKAIYAPRERRNGTSDDLTAARIRREEAEAEVKELKAAEMRGDLVWVKDVIDDLSKTFGAIRSVLRRADLPADDAEKLEEALNDCFYLDD